MIAILKSMIVVCFIDQQVLDVSMYVSKVIICKEELVLLFIK